MGQLHLFSDGVEYYSAETVEEAYAAREQRTGVKSPATSSNCCDVTELAQVDDERMLTVWLDPDQPGRAGLGALENRSVSRTAAEWAALAMGFAFSTEV